jgi:hypothetical protein
MLNDRRANMKRIVFTALMILVTMAMVGQFHDLKVTRDMGTDIAPPIGIAKWTGTGWAIDSIGKTAHHAASAGTNALGPGTNMPVQPGRTYQLCFTTSGIASSSIVAAMGGVTVATISTNGDWCFDVTPTATTALTFTPSNTSLVVTISKVSVKPYVGGDASIGGNVTIGGNTTITGNATVTGTLTTTGGFSGSGASLTTASVPVTALDTSDLINKIYYVDGSRTDSYTADGTYILPYKTILAAVTKILADYTAAADKQTTTFTVKIAPGTYSDNLTITTVKHLRFEGIGVTISGNIAINQDPIGGSGQQPYTRIEFLGHDGYRAEKGAGMTISGTFTCTRSNDSLTYLNFRGCYITGAQLYDTDGTWVTHFDNCRVNGTMDTGTFADADSTVLLETTGINTFAGAITDKITFYSVDRATFSGAIAITPIFDCRMTDCQFSSSVSIVASKNLDLDSITRKNLLARTPTLTGMTLRDLGTTYGASIVFEGATADTYETTLTAADPTVDATVTIPNTTGTINLTTLTIVPESTPVNAVAATATLTTDNTDVTDGKIVVVNDVTYRFKSTMAQANDVKISGVDGDTTLGNLVAAVNLSGTEGVEYFAGTTSPTDVAAGAVGSHATIMTATTKGVIGNSYAKSEDDDHLDWNGTGAVFTGGVDGTVGVANEIRADGSYLYHCITTNTIADTNWRRIDLGSAY